MKLDRIDHFVLTVANIDVTCDFYVRVLGLQVEIFKGGRRALAFGNQKINLHQAGAEFLPRADKATPGSGDFCLISQTPLEQVIAHLNAEDVTIEQGPVKRTGATGPILSVYLRDPDQNLIEISQYSD